MRSTSVQLLILTVGVGLVSCGGNGDITPVPVTEVGGNQGVGGAATGGVHNVGGSTTATLTGGTSSNGGQATGGKSATTATGGAPQTGGAPSTGGKSSATGGAATGGSKASGGAATGGSKASGGAATGGSKATGGAATGGSGSGGSGLPTGGAATGGAATGGFSFALPTGGAGTGGTKASGGSAATGGTTTINTGTSAIDCNATMPTGGTDHCGQNTQGNAGGLSWSLWSNTLSSSACITTFSTPAFSARWNNNGDFLARVGLEFGNAGKTYDQYGTIKADFAYKKTGSAGGYSYIGVYGWSTNPCVEWYIVDDRWGTMPFNAYNATQKGKVSIDGADYVLFQNKTNGTGGSRCSGVSQWDQYWSIRQSARQCGTITISEHFKAWDAAGLKLGGLLEAKILVESGGGTGDIQFPVANVTAQ